MIVNVMEMKNCEQNSGLSEDQLIELAGQKIAEALLQDTTENQRLLFVCGKGNNGGDGIVACHFLQGKRTCFCVTYHEHPLLLHYSDVPHFPLEKCSEILPQADVIIDCIYGFSFHLPLSIQDQLLFTQLQQAHKPIISIDINSGYVADTAMKDEYAIQSDLTYALGYAKPFHVVPKWHHAFKKCRILPLSLGYPNSPCEFEEMNESLFASLYPFRPENSYKGQGGHTGIIAGSEGLAGACMLNILGALSVGANYLHVGLDKSIYPMVASRYMQPVFHFLDDLSFLDKCTAISFGSGMNHFVDAEAILNQVVKWNGTLILDAYGLDLIRNRKLNRSACTILTPHLQEFSRLCGLSSEQLQDDLIETAKTFAKQHQCVLILKGVHTIVTDGTRVYLNQTGNQALATAGSGDFLTGVLAFLATHLDGFTASKMAVWCCGKVAEMASLHHAKETVAFEHLQEELDRLLWQASKQHDTNQN